MWPGTPPQPQYGAAIITTTTIPLPPDTCSKTACLSSSQFLRPSTLSSHPLYVWCWCNGQTTSQRGPHLLPPSPDGIPLQSGVDYYTAAAPHIVDNSPVSHIPRDIWTSIQSLLALVYVPTPFRLMVDEGSLCIIVEMNANLVKDAVSLHNEARRDIW